MAEPFPTPPQQERPRRGGAIAAASVLGAVPTAAGLLGSRPVRMRGGKQVGSVAELARYARPGDLIVSSSPWSGRPGRDWVKALASLGTGHPQGHHAAAVVDSVGPDGVTIFELTRKRGFKRTALSRVPNDHVAVFRSQKGPEMLSSMRRKVRLTDRLEQELLKRGVTPEQARGVRAGAYRNRDLGRIGLQELFPAFMPGNHEYDRVIHDSHLQRLERNLIHTADQTAAQLRRGRRARPLACIGGSCTNVLSLSGAPSNPHKSVRAASAADLVRSGKFQPVAHTIGKQGRLGSVLDAVLTTSPHALRLAAGAGLGVGAYATIRALQRRRAQEP